jgi:hypothetical protein
VECEQRAKYLGDLQSPGRIDALGKQALDDITGVFHRTLSYGIATDQLTNVRLDVSTRFARDNPFFCFIRCPQGGGRCIEGATRFYVLNDSEWLLTIQNDSWVGAYNNLLGAILLRSSSRPGFSWCKNTLIHETLHSVSLYSRIYAIPGIMRLHLDLNEGITECLTGYAMFQRHQECYTSWKQTIKGGCSVAYKPVTKVFCSLAQVIGVSPLANFYFSENTAFQPAWDQFINEIHAAGNEKFMFSLTSQTSFRLNNFIDECVKNILGFKKIYRSAFHCLDFSQIHEAFALKSPK